jgi:imidazolonepropionase-like amidohydrolase
VSSSRPLAVIGGTVIDATGRPPLEDTVVLVEAARISGIGKSGELAVPNGAQVIDAHGRFVIPGLMNANVHLFGDIRPESLAQHWGQYEDIVLEAAQIALKGGLTTVLDTWGPRRFLMAARDRIAAGEASGSRIFCAGNIVGFDGPMSPDFLAKAVEVVSSTFANRINAIWTENTGRHLMWLPPERVAEEMRRYINTGIDFVKYGSNEHFGTSAGAFIAFSERAQAAIVDEAHRAGITAQAHCTSVEGLRMAIEAGCDLITHCNITGPVPIPESTLELFAARQTGAVIFPWTERGLQWIKDNVSDTEWTMWEAGDTNARNLIKSGASLMLANDGMVRGPAQLADTARAQSWGSAPEEESLISLGSGHVFWFRAMEEKGCEPMRMLQAATRNIAVAYGKGNDLGTLEAGKIADMVILDQNPLQAAKNYESISMVIKDGAVVDRDALPLNPVLTRPLDPPEPEEALLIPAITTARFPMCPLCTWR